MCLAQQKTEWGSPPLPDFRVVASPDVYFYFSAPRLEQGSTSGGTPYTGICGTGFADPFEAREVQVSNFRSGQLTPARQNIFWWHKQLNDIIGCQVRSKM
jgi:hypothetical protein